MKPPREATGAELAKFDRIRALLADANTLPEIIKAGSMAKAAVVLAKRAHLKREAVNQVAEMQVDGDRKAGAAFQQLEKSKGGRPENRGKKTPAMIAGVSEYQRVLEETKTPERTAQLWQKAAAIPESDFHDYCAKVNASETGLISTAGLLQAANHAKRKASDDDPMPFNEMAVTTEFIHKTRQVLRTLWPAGTDIGPIVRALRHYADQLEKGTW